MNISTILNPGDVGTPSSLNQTAESLHNSNVHDGDSESSTQSTIGRTSSLRNLRSSSYTVIVSRPPTRYPTPLTGTATARRRASKRQPPTPLSFEQQTPTNPSRHRAGRSNLSNKHKTKSSTSVKASKPTQSTPKRLHRRKSQQPKAPSMSAAGLLLSRARQSVSRETHRLGHKPSIMDTIMDLKSSVVEYQEEIDVVIDAIERSQGLRRHFSGGQEYTFTDQESLDAYWDEQAAAVGRSSLQFDVDDSPSAATGLFATRFPDSTERSTAFWAPTLDGDRL